MSFPPRWISSTAGNASIPLLTLTAEREGRMLRALIKIEFSDQANRTRE